MDARLLRRVVLAGITACAVVLGSAGALVARTAAVHAQDADAARELSIEDRREIVRKLSKEEKDRLRAALERFRSLPKATQEELRAKAEKVGPERLRDLAGADVPRLKAKHREMEAEIDAVFAQIGEHRLASLGTEERAYLRSIALRGFGLHLNRRLLGYASLEGMAQEFDRLPPEEKRRRRELAWRRLEDDQITRLPEAEQARLRSLPAAERRAARAQLMADFRRNEIAEFARIFDRWRLEPLLRLPEAERARKVTRWREKSRWFEAARLLREDVGLDGDTVARLSPLGPGSWGRVLLEIRDTEELAPAERRIRLTELVNRLAGEHALLPADVRTAAPPLVEALRSRRAQGGPFGPRPEKRHERAPGRGNDRGDGRRPETPTESPKNGPDGR